MKKLFAIAATVMLSNSVFALDFMGQTLENMNRTQLTQFLESEGMRRNHQETLVDTFSVKNNVVPHAKWVKAYYNKEAQFVGLKVGLDYDERNYINLRKAMVEKYGNNYIYKDFFGESHKQDFTKDYFSDIVTWKQPNNRSIEFNAYSFDQDRMYGDDSYAFIVMMVEKKH